MKRTLFLYYTSEEWEQHTKINMQIEELNEKRRRLEIDAKQHREEYFSQLSRDVEELCKIFREDDPAAEARIVCLHTTAHLG